MCIRDRSYSWQGDKADEHAGQYNTILEAFTNKFGADNICLLYTSQQALWGGAAVVSPDIHDDNTVTFRLKAPKAVRLQITGDFLRWV